VFPLNHKWDRCLEIANLSMPLLLNSETDSVFRVHHLATNTVPHTVESFWSGHFIPAIESLAEAEVSCNLALCGYYKQAMTSLRGVLELGLLSVYWNVGDDGHVIIKRWLHSQEDTPRPSEIWARLSTHHGLAQFCEAYDLSTRIKELFGDLSNFVHSRGRLYSNDYWHPDHGFSVGQALSEERIAKWIQTYREIVWVILGLHMAKYPIATIRYEWSRKFGIDVPSFGGLSAPEVDMAEAFLGVDVFRLLQEIAKADTHTTELMQWIKSKPDMTEDAVEQQIRKMDMSDIEHKGFEAWEMQERKLYGSLPDGLPDVVEHRIQELHMWAEENGYLDSPDWILDHLRGDNGNEALQ